MERDFRVETTTDSRGCVLTLHGELDIASSELLEAEFQRVEDSARVVVDLTSLEFIDSTGLGLLCKRHQRLEQAGGSLILTGGGGQVKRLLAMTGLDGQLRIVSHLDEALAAD